MNENSQPSDFEHYARRRRRQGRDRRMLNNLPLAHRLAGYRAIDQAHREELLGHAMVGLVEAADAFDETEAGCRFGSYAEPRINQALARTPDAAEVEAAQAEIAEAIASQDRVQELAGFLDVPIDALVGGLMDATARERVLHRHRPVRGAA